MHWLTKMLSSLKSEKKQHIEQKQNESPPLSLEYIKKEFQNIHDAKTIEIHNDFIGNVTLFYIRSLVDVRQLQEFVIFPLQHASDTSLRETVSTAEVNELNTLEKAKQAVLKGSVILHVDNRLWSITLPNSISRAIETSEQESIIYGPKDSFSEQIDQNLTLIRRRLPISSLKSEELTIGSMSATTVILLYIDGLTNPELIQIAREKTMSIQYDTFLDTSHFAHFLEDHIHSVFPQFQQTDRPDAVVAALTSGKVVWLVDNTPFALVGPITFFDLFQSPEDYIHRWMVASFLRGLRFFAFLFAIVLTPLYVALTMHHYQMMPIELLYVLLESRSQIPFNPFWEALFMLLTLEILKEASHRMPTKSGQTLGVVGGIVIGQAAVAAQIASNILIIHVAVMAIASFLVPNYLMTNSSKLIQFGLLILAAWLGMWGITFGLIMILIHLHGLTSLKQPYFSPLTPFYANDWKDTIIRLPFRWMNQRPTYLKPLKKYKFVKRK